MDAALIFIAIKCNDIHLMAMNIEAASTLYLVRPIILLKGVQSDNKYFELKFMVQYSAEGLDLEYIIIYTVYVYIYSQYLL